MMVVGAFHVGNVAGAAPFNNNNLLITTDDFTDSIVYEYTLAGAQVQSYTVPNVSDYPIRGLSADTSTSELHVYNGTFTPSLSTLDTATDLWSHDAPTGWSTVNNVSYGGVAHAGGYVFVSDMATAGAGSPKGIIRIKPGEEALRFGETWDYTDVSIGLDGYVYALVGSNVHVYNGVTLAPIKTISTGVSSPRGVVSNAIGDIYVVDWFGDLHWLDGDGTPILTLDLTLSGAASQLMDIAIREDGVIAVGDWFGGVTLTDDSLSAPTHFATVGVNGVFVDFPGDIALSYFDPDASLPVSTPLLLGVLMLFIGLSARRVLRQQN